MASADGRAGGRAVEIALPGLELEGDLSLPQGAAGLVLFVHGSGSSRFSSRNRYVASVLQGMGLGTLLFDLLSSQEDEVDRLTAQYRFDIDLLTERVLNVTAWLRRNPETMGLLLGYFGASTGAAAALAAAAQTESIAAVVSRGGRPDLAGRFLPSVGAPTLLIVGENDPVVVGLNRQALARLRGIKDLRIVSGATHLFEEPGTLEEAARLAGEWFVRYLVDGSR
jgi:putative phosphoribosyl transferase